MKWLWIVQCIIDIVLILVIVGYRAVFNDMLKNIDTLNKNMGKTKDLTEAVENLRKSILGRG
jgi:uncharacterized protein YutE (UPF0331/DUF86 family)